MTERPEPTEEDIRTRDGQDDQFMHGVLEDEVE